ALTDALVNGRLGAAGLDVFHDEPNVPAALVALDNVVLTPHVASSTEETVQAMSDCVVDNLVSWFEGRGALTPVTSSWSDGDERAARNRCRQTHRPAAFAERHRRRA